MGFFDWMKGRREPRKPPLGSFQLTISQNSSDPADYAIHIDDHKREDLLVHVRFNPQAGVSEDMAEEVISKMAQSIAQYIQSEMVVRRAVNGMRENKD